MAAEDNGYGRLYVIREPLLFRAVLVVGFFIAFLVSGFAGLEFVTTLGEELLALFAFLLSAALLVRYTAADHIEFFEDRIFISNGRKSAFLWISETASFSDGGLDEQRHRLIRVETNEGVSELVPLKKFLSKQEDFDEVLNTMNQWLEDPNSISD